MRPTLPIEFVVTSTLSQIDKDGWEVARPFFNRTPPHPSEVMQICNSPTEIHLSGPTQRIRVAASQNCPYESVEIVRTIEGDDKQSHYNYRFLGVNHSHEGDQIQDLCEFRQSDILSVIPKMDALMLAPITKPEPVIPRIKKEYYVPQKPEDFIR
jgi:hypothetical protein